MEYAALGYAFVEGSKDKLCLRKMTQMSMGRGSAQRFHYLQTTGTRVPSGKRNKAGEVRNQQIRRNRENGQLRGRFDVVGNKDPLRVSEQGSDLMKTAIEEDEIQAGLIRGKHQTPRGSCNPSPREVKKARAMNSVQIN